MGYSHDIQECQQKVFDEIKNNAEEVSDLIRRFNNYDNEYLVKQLLVDIQYLVINIPDCVDDLYRGRQRIREALDDDRNSCSCDYDTQADDLSEDITELEKEVKRLTNIIEGLYKEKAQEKFRHVDLWLELQV